jgi:hypothetical protein
MITYVGRSIQDSVTEKERDVNIQSQSRISRILR